MSGRSVLTGEPVSWIDAYVQPPDPSGIGGRLWFFFVSALLDLRMLPAENGADYLHVSRTSWLTSGVRSVKGKSAWLDCGNGVNSCANVKAARPRLCLEEVPATGVPSTAAAFSYIDPDLACALCPGQPMNGTAAPPPAPR